MKKLIENIVVILVVVESCYLHVLIFFVVVFIVILVLSKFPLTFICLRARVVCRLGSP